MPYFESSKRTQDAINESLGKTKPKPKKVAEKKPKKKESDQEYFNRLRREAIERAKAAR